MAWSALFVLSPAVPSLKSRLYYPAILADYIRYYDFVLPAMPVGALFEVVDMPPKAREAPALLALA